MIDVNLGNFCLREGRVYMIKWNENGHGRMAYKMVASSFARGVDDGPMARSMAVLTARRSLSFIQSRL
jgi:hypothetical protein